MLLAAGGATAPSMVHAQAETEEIQKAIDISKAFKQVARDVTPAVVNIQSTRQIQAPQLRQRMPFFFGPSPRNPQMMPEEQQSFEQRSEGSGVIVDPEGYILTNSHVVSGASEVDVRLSDDRSFLAEVVGVDEKTDLAVLMINASDLPVAQLGNSDAMDIGDWVLAIGNPFGLDATVTAGIVSAKGRSRVGLADYEDFIQTDAAINPGNSGGPLVNLNGEVIGINTAILSRSGGFAGIGFAIPVNMAKNIMNSIISEGKVTRGWLGVVIQDLTTDLAESFGYDSREGVLVSDVMEGGPASAAGFQSGDIIISYDGRKVRDTNELRFMVAETAPGEKVPVEVFREGDNKKLRVEVEELKSEVVANNGTSSSQDLGLTVQGLTPEMRQQLNAPNVSGVVIADIESGSAAAHANLIVGDIIVSVNGKEVSNINEFNQQVRRGDLQKGLRMQVITEGSRRFVLVKKNR
jgi:serine protease Do